MGRCMGNVGCWNLQIKNVDRSGLICMQVDEFCGYFNNFSTEFLKSCLSSEAT